MSTKNRLMAMAALAATAMASSASANVAPGVYIIVPEHTLDLKVLDVANASQADGAAVNQFRTNGGLNQRWRVTQTGSTTLDTPVYSLIAQHSLKCLEIPNESTAPGRNARQRTCHFRENQQFFINDLPGSTSFGTITPRHSGLPLQIEDKSQANGAPLEQNFFGPGSVAPLHQQFALFRVSN